MRRSAIVASGLLLAVACAPRRTALPGPGDDDGAVSESVFGDDVPMRVENRFYGDVVIYLDRGGMRARLATITGSTTRDILIPRRFFNTGVPVRLIAEGIGASSGGERVTTNTGDLLVRPGQRIVWSLETQLQRSTVGVY
jgi:hypothetical protein